MKHQQAILAQRLENAKSGIKSTEEYLNGVSMMLNPANKIDLEQIQEEISEIRDFILWVQNQ